MKHFQDNWDVNAPDFADMLERSLAKTDNLLASMNNFPARMIGGFAKTAPEGGALDVHRALRREPGLLRARGRV